jgi:hypothetical protein
MVVALPTRTRIAFMAMGKNGYAGSWVGDGKPLIAAEAFRLIVTDDHGARLPFAAPPELSSRGSLPYNLSYLVAKQTTLNRSASIVCPAALALRPLMMMPSRLPWRIV